MDGRCVMEWSGGGSEGAGVRMDVSGVDRRWGEVKDQTMGQSRFVPSFGKSQLVTGWIGGSVGGMEGVSEGGGLKGWSFEGVWKWRRGLDGYDVRGGLNFCESWGGMGVERIGGWMDGAEWSVGKFDGWGGCEWCERY